MALFEEREGTKFTFKDAVKNDVHDIFFDMSEFAKEHLIDGKKALVVAEDIDLREHDSHWEGGAKQNFDTGLYTSHTVLYIKVEDYGPKPKIGKQLIMDEGTKVKRTFSILKCEEEDGIYRMTMERKRQ